MSDNAIGSARDVTAIRRNPGTGIVGTWSCALCSRRHTQQTGLRRVRFGGARWTLMCKGGGKRAEVPA